MLKKIFKSTLSIFMASILFLAPAFPAQAASAAIATDETAKTASLTGMEEVKASAKKKADIITSIYGVTSLQYALISDGEVILSGESGFKDIASKTAPTQSTKYIIGSVSKIFTTLAVLKLVDEGKVSLDSPVITYLPEFKMADDRYKQITVRMLLNHSSGLMGSTLDNVIMLGSEDTTMHDTFLDALAKQRLKADPGAFSVYCNDGFTLAEILIEKVSGVSFSKFIETNITKPLDMTNTKTPEDSFDRSTLAAIYQADGTKLPYESFGAFGAGGIISTASDLLKLSTLFTSSSTLISDTLIASMANEEYRRGQWFPEGDTVLTYGLGWDSVNTYPFTKYNIKALVKGGDTIYNHTSFIVLPDDNMAVAVLSSGGSSSINQIFGQSILLESLKEKGRINTILPDKTFTAPVKTAIPSELLKYEGYYANTTALMKVSMKESGTLIIQSIPSTMGTQTMIYGGDNKFYSPDGTTSLSFVEDNGRTYIYTSSYPSLTLIGQTAMSLYQGEKITPSKLTKKTAASWEKYIDKNYFMVSEKYNSFRYPLGLPYSSLYISEELPNYFGNAEITDGTTALVNIQIPGSYGRDLKDIKLIEKNGTAYITGGETVMISEDAIKALSSKKSFSVTIPKDVYAKYYKINSKTAGKKITVTLPEKSSFTVYDKSGNFVFSSYLSGKKSVKLPKGGYIVFSGSHKAKFNVKY